MTTLTPSADSGRTRRHLSDERQFRVLVALTFPIFLVVVLANCLVGKRPPVQGAQSRFSIFSEAKTAASTAIAIGFMG